MGNGNTDRTQSPAEPAEPAPARKREMEEGICVLHASDPISQPEISYPPTVDETHTKPVRMLTKPVARPVASVTEPRCSTERECMSRMPPPVRDGLQRQQKITNEGKGIDTS